MTPKNCTRLLYEAWGWTIGEVETRLTRTLVRDLFGIADLVAFTETHTCLVQAGHIVDHMKHHRTILEQEAILKRWLKRSDRGVTIVSWNKPRTKSRVRAYSLRDSKINWKDQVTDHDKEAAWLRKVSKRSSPAPSR